jgi:hypothetical protein
MRSLSEDGWRLVAEGITTPEEVLRVTKEQSAEEEQPKAGAAAEIVATQGDASTAS